MEQDVSEAAYANHALRFFITLVARTIFFLTFDHANGSHSDAPFPPSTPPHPSPSPPPAPAPPDAACLPSPLRHRSGQHSESVAESKELFGLGSQDMTHEISCAIPKPPSGYLDMFYESCTSGSNIQWLLSPSHRPFLPPLSTRSRHASSFAGFVVFTGVLLFASIRCPPFFPFLVFIIVQLFSSIIFPPFFLVLVFIIVRLTSRLEATSTTTSSTSSSSSTLEVVFGGNLGTCRS